MRRAPLRSDELAAMAEAIDQHADSVMSAEKLLGRVISLEHRVVVLGGGLEYGEVECIRFLQDDFITQSSISALDLVLIDRHPPCINFSTPRPYVAQQRRAVHANEKARRKTMPRGRR